MSQPLNVLFLCTGNSARSILAEALLNRSGRDQFRAFSAGSFPKREVHPMALKVLAEEGFPVEALRSKSWDEFAGPDAPPLDLILTVCDNAAGEVCPIWPGKPLTAHWGIEDPAIVEGEGQREAFLTVFARLEKRIGGLLALPVEAMDGAGLKQHLVEIGKDQSIAV